MKYQTYPSIFDVRGTDYREIDGSPLHERYKIGQLNDPAKEIVDDYFDKEHAIGKKMKLPIILLYICGILFAMLLFGEINAWLDVGFETAYKNAPYLVWLMLVFFVLTITMFLFYFLTKRKSERQLSELEQNEGQNLDNILTNELELPPSARIFCFFQRIYSRKKGKLSGNACQSFVAYEDELNVHIWFDAMQLKIPKSECTSAEIVPHKLMYTDVSMAVNYKSPEIKEYKITTNQYGMHIVKDFGRLIFQSGTDIWSLDIPRFAFNDMARLFGKFSA